MFSNVFKKNNNFRLIVFINLVFIKKKVCISLFVCALSQESGRGKKSWLHPNFILSIQKSILCSDTQYTFAIVSFHELFVFTKNKCNCRETVSLLWKTPRLACSRGGPISLSFSLRASTCPSSQPFYSTEETSLGVTRF